MYIQSDLGFFLYPNQLKCGGRGGYPPFRKAVPLNFKKGGIWQQNYFILKARTPHFLFLVRYLCLTYRSFRLQPLLYVRSLPPVSCLHDSRAAAFLRIESCLLFLLVWTSEKRRGNDFTVEDLTSFVPLNRTQTADLSP